MIKTEKQLWQLLKKAFPRNGKIKMDRIETATRSGVPDICYTNGAINGWLELKVSKIANINSGLSANQIIWLKEHPYSFVLIAEVEHFLLLDVDMFFKIIFDPHETYLESLKKYGLNTSTTSKKHISELLEAYLSPYLTGKHKLIDY